MILFLIEKLKIGTKKLPKKEMNDYITKDCAVQNKFTIIRGTTEHQL